jgi:hypothetical protein
MILEVQNVSIDPALSVHEKNVSKHHVNYPIEAIIKIY